MTVRVLLDANVATDGVGRRLAAAGHDVGALDQEPALDALADEDVLELAAKDGSVFVTLNTGDYPPVLRDRLAAGSRSHAGVILLHGIAAAEFELAATAVERCLAARPSQADWVDHAVLVDRAQVSGELARAAAPAR